MNPHDKYEMVEGSTVSHIKGDILHYSYYTIDQHYKQVGYFTTVAAEAYYKKGKRAKRINLWLNPAVKFLSSYIFELGFLDGRYGFIICRISAYATYLKYKKLRKLQRDAKASNN